MLLPSFLQDSYKQYKDDTNRFATWLVNIAKKVGHQPAHLPSASTGKKKPAGSGPQQANYQATVGELLKLARTVSESPVKAPTSVLDIAKRAIALRKNVTSWFLGRGPDAANERHAHFIQVMEEICDILSWEAVEALAPTNSVNADTASAGADIAAESQAWMNRFSALSVDEIEDGPDIVATHTDIIHVEAVERDLEGDTEDYLSHGFFRLLCLFHDLHNWRSFLSDTWTEYSNLKIDLASASVITDTAMQLARDFIQDAMNDLPAEFPKKGLDLQQFVYAMACESSGAFSGPSVHLGLPFDEAMADLVSWSYLSTGILLQSFIPIIQAKSVPVYKPGHYGTYDAKADRSKMSIAESFNEDKILMLELLPEYAMLGIFNAPLPVRDEITSGFIDYIQTKESSLWLCFASQVMLDAHHATRHSRVGASVDLRMAGLRIARTIDDYWKLSETHPRPEFWPQEGDDEIKRIRDTITDWIENDPLLMLRQTASQELSRPERSNAQQLLFSRNPVLCGLLTFHLNIRMQTIGQGLVTQWYDVQQLAFLYNLIQMTPGSKLEWPDMELFIKIHGENNIFVGNRPKDAAQSLNRLELATGISSPTRFAKNPRGKKDSSLGVHKPNGMHSRRLKPTSTQAVNLFRKHYEEYTPGTAPARSIHSADIGRFLDDLSQGSSGSAVSRKRSKGKNLSRSRELLGRKWRNTHQVGGLQLLALMKDKLFEEEPILMFDYFGMHKRAVDILRLIKAKEHHKFVQYFSAQYMPSEAFISNLVILIHHVARGSALAGQEMGLASLSASRSEPSSRMVHSCRGVMGPYLEKNGEAAIKYLMAFCTNKKRLQMMVDGQREIDSSDADDEKFMHWFCLDEVLGPKEMESLKTGIPLA